MSTEYTIMNEWAACYMELKHEDRTGYRVVAALTPNNSDLSRWMLRREGDAYRIYNVLLGTSMSLECTPDKQGYGPTLAPTRAGAADQLWKLSKPVKGSTSGVHIVSAKIVQNDLKISITNRAAPGENPPYELVAIIDAPGSLHQMWTFHAVGDAADDAGTEVTGQ